MFHNRIAAQMEASPTSMDPSSMLQPESFVFIPLPGLSAWNLMAVMSQQLLYQAAFANAQKAVRRGPLDRFIQQFWN